MTDTTVQPIPQLLAMAEATDPALAPKLLLASRSPPGVFAVALLTWLVARYGLQLDPTVVDAGAGVAVLLAGYAFRSITKRPIAAGIFSLTPKLTPVLALLAIGGLGLAACSPADDTKIAAALASPTGQLFCKVQMAGGGSMIAGVTDAEATALAPSLAPVAVIATGLAKTRVDDLCNEAAVRAGAVAGTPVPPPLDPALAQLLPVVVSLIAQR
jgi:hypothetical protein